MKQRRTRFISLLMFFVMILGLLPVSSYADSLGHTHSFDEVTHGCICGAHEDCLNNHTGWTEWTDSSALPMNSGKYYLAKDVRLTSSWSPSNNADIELCLNGHVIDAGGVPFFDALSGEKHVCIFDCKDTPHYFVDEKEIYV